MLLVLYFYLLCVHFSLQQAGGYVNSQKGSQQQNILPGTLQYGQIVGSVPPSQMFLQYDQGVGSQQAPPSATGATPSQGLQQSSAQIIGSQLMAQQRSAPVQNLPQTPQSSFYSHQTPLQQTGFYQAQQTSTAVQVCQRGRGQGGGRVER